MIVLRRAFIAAGITWAAALPLATLVASRPQGPPGMYLAAVVVYGAGGAVCHQRPERTFHLWSVQMPVCARCTGIYAGAGIAAFLLLIRRVGQAAPTSLTVVRLLLLSASLPTLATIGFEWITGDAPANYVRALTGVLLGGAVAWAIGSALAEPREVN
jgi:uncharacterized membrane protein